jgi:hypothetical protein
MKFYVGTVVSNIDRSQSGEMLVRFPKLYDNSPQVVTYTSPFCKANAGGFIAIPEVGDQILALYNENPGAGENSIYYHSTIIKTEISNDPAPSNENFSPLRSSDSKAQIYGEKNKPVTQTFTNIAGAGLYIQREFTDSKISNNVTMRSEGGEEVNVGPLGVQLRNADGDSITLNGPEPNDAYGARTMAIQTQSSQEYKCVAGDINMKIVDGGDINIENNSFGIFALPPWFGNIRLKSRFRDITLAALGPESKVHIVTNGTQVIVDSLGGVKIVTAGNIDFAAGQDINMTAGGTVNIVGNLGAQVGSVGGAASVNAPTVFINNQPFAFNAGPPGSDFTNSTPVPGAPATPPIPPVIVPNDYGDPGSAD